MIVGDSPDLLPTDDLAFEQNTRNFVQRRFVGAQQSGRSILGFVDQAASLPVNERCRLGADLVPQSSLSLQVAEAAPLGVALPGDRAPSDRRAPPRPGVILSGAKNLSRELSGVTGNTYVVALGALRDPPRRPPEAGVAAQDDPIVDACPKRAAPGHFEGCDKMLAKPQLVAGCFACGRRPL